MKKILLIFSVLTIIFSSCSKKEDEPEALPPQTIVTSDTSEITGELTVHTYNDITKSPMTHVDVYLYAEYNDVITDMNGGVNDLAIYRLYTDNESYAYFGFINYGNYYVLAIKDEAGTHYEKLSIVQVRPRRDEHLNLYLIPTN